MDKQTLDKLKQLAFPNIEFEDTEPFIVKQIIVRAVSSLQGISVDRQKCRVAEGYWNVPAIVWIKDFKVVAFLPCLSKERAEYYVSLIVNDLYTDNDRNIFDINRLEHGSFELKYKVKEKTIG